MFNLSSSVKINAHDVLMSTEPEMNDESLPKYSILIFNKKQNMSADSLFHLFFIHHWTSSEGGIAPFMPAFRCQELVITSFAPVTRLMPSTLTPASV